jgi:hypothetical protein
LFSDPQKPEDHEKKRKKNLPPIATVSVCQREKKEREMSPSHPLPPPAHCCPNPLSQRVFCFLNLPSSSAPWKVFPPSFFGNKRLTQCELFGANFGNFAIFFQKMEKKRKTNKHTHTQTHFFGYFKGFSRHLKK